MLQPVWCPFAHSLLTRARVPRSDHLVHRQGRWRTPHTYLHGARLPRQLLRRAHATHMSNAQSHRCRVSSQASKWNHIGIVVRPAPNKVYLLEWAGGLIVAPLHSRLAAYFRFGSFLLSYRPLVVPSERADRVRLEAAIEEFAVRLQSDRARVDNDKFPLAEAIPGWCHRESGGRTRAARVTPSP